MKIKRLTSPNDRPYYSDMEERLMNIEDILGDEYDLDRLCELAQALRLTASASIALAIFQRLQSLAHSPLTVGQ